MKKAIISNRIYLSRTKELHDSLIKSLTYVLPSPNPGRPNITYCDVTRINTDILTIPIGRQDLIPEDYVITDKRVLNKVYFPTFKFELRESQRKIVEEVEDNCLINANPSWGKAQPSYSKIRTPNGWTTMGDIKEGDEIITPNNTISRVTGKYDHKNKDIYELTFYDGRVVHACSDHLWEVFLHSSKKWVVVDTIELVRKLKTKSARIYVPLCKTIDDSKKELPLDPYLLGFLIGDGSFTTNSISISTADDFIIDKLSHILPDNHNIKHSSKYDYYLTGDGKENAINTQLKKLGLSGCKSHEKFIPDIYKYSCLEDKFRLIQGLFDADGSAEKNAASFEYTSTSNKLIHDICDIIYSLGGIANIQTRQTYYTYKGEKKKGKISYRIRPTRLNLHIKKKFFSLPRKKDRIKSGAYDNSGKIRIESIKFLNKQDCSCISIDSKEKLYLTDNYIVTHNTFTGIAIACKLSQKTLVIVHTKKLFLQWIEEVEKTIGIKSGMVGDGKYNIDSPIVIGMSQSLRSRMPELRGIFGTVIVDECHHIPATVFKGILDDCRAKYKLGLSATMWRKDGKHILLKDYTGDKTYYPKDENKVKAKVTIIRSNIKFCSEGFKPWSVRVNMLMQDPDYMELVMNLSQAQVRRGHKVLTVGDRVEFLESCGDFLEDFQVIAGTSSDTVVDLETYNGILGTGKIFSEGVNYPPLSSLIMAYPINNRALLTQLIGRIERPFEGKMQPEAIDIGLRSKTTEYQLSQRINFYTNEGYEIKYVEL